MLLPPPRVSSSSNGQQAVLPVGKLLLEMLRARAAVLS